jgi:hypothetical protein
MSYLFGIVIPKRGSIASAVLLAEADSSPSRPGRNDKQFLRAGAVWRPNPLN